MTGAENEMRTRVWIVTGLVLATAVYCTFLSDVRQIRLQDPLSVIPETLTGWSSIRSEKMDGKTLQVVGVDDYLWREYRDSKGSLISVYVGFYGRQREGSQIHSPKHCLPGGGWHPLKSEVVTLETPGFNGGVTRANRYVIAKGDERQLVLYWYQSQGRDVTSDYMAKLWLVSDSIFRKRSDGSLVRFISTLRDPGQVAEVQARMAAFCKVFLPELARVLPN